MSDLVVVDLFAGAGGLSTGVGKACEDSGLEPGEDLELHAINHWEPAIQTHEQNHPWADHYHAKIEELHPPNVVEPGEVTLLTGGPECTHFSTARGGQPVSEQKRASAWHVLDWIEKLRPEHVLLENVKEFRQWGPIVDEKPSRDGSIFERWVGMLEAFGYSVLYDDAAEDYGVVLNAADYGDPQSRERLFIMASRSTRPTPPAPTHVDADPQKPDRRTAADVIDWADLGSSLWVRDLENPRVQPLSENTMRRIAEGIRRHCDDRLSPLADALETIGPDRLDQLREHVVPIEYAGVVAEAVGDPFLVHSSARSVPHTSQVIGQHGNAVARDVNARALPTVATGGKIHLTNPETVSLRQGGGGVPSAVDSPLSTVLTDGAISIASASRALIQPRNGPNGGWDSNIAYPSESKPLHTVIANDTRQGHVLTPYLVEYYGNGRAQPVDEPLPTVTTRDRYALCVPEHWPYGLDVRYRMLQPRELKQAQGFPSDYDIVGDTKKCVTKQIGNAVPVHLAKSLVGHLLANETPSLSTFGGGLQDTDADVPKYEEVVGDD